MCNRRSELTWTTDGDGCSETCALNDIRDIGTYCNIGTPRNVVNQCTCDQTRWYVEHTKRLYYDNTVHGSGTDRTRFIRVIYVLYVFIYTISCYMCIAPTHIL